MSLPLAQRLRKLRKPGMMENAERISLAAFVQDGMHVCRGKAAEPAADRPLNL